jgi:hypothetical protein
MVCLPLVAVYEITTEVTSAACLRKNLIAFSSGKLPSDHSIPPFDLALTSLLPKRMQSPRKVGIGSKFIGRAGFFHGTPIQVCGTKCSVISVPAIPRRVCEQIM